MHLPDGQDPQDPAERDAKSALETALEAAAAARDASGLAREGWQLAQRHAFATLVFGLTSAILSERAASDDPQEVAVAVLRHAMRLSYREAQGLADAIAAALTADRPHEAVQALVRCGWLAGRAWALGDQDEFDARVVQATASDAFASDRPLL